MVFHGSFFCLNAGSSPSGLLAAWGAPDFCGVGFPSCVSGQTLPAESGLSGKKTFNIFFQRKERRFLYPGSTAYQYATPPHTTAAALVPGDHGAETDVQGTLLVKRPGASTREGASYRSLGSKEGGAAGFSLPLRESGAFLSGRWPEPEPRCCEQENRRVVERKVSRAGWRHEGLRQGREESVQGGTRSCAFLPACGARDGRASSSSPRGAKKGRRRAGLRGLCAGEVLCR